jgi:Ni/Fe-hydrogenase subunit HybB-like protein
MFLLENFCFVAPLLLLASPSRRGDLRSLFISSCLLLLAGSIYRFNAFLIGYSAGPGWTYFPALPEILITLSIIALELMGYLYFVKRYPVLPKVEHA